MSSVLSPWRGSSVLVEREHWFHLFANAPHDVLIGLLQEVGVPVRTPSLDLQDSKEIKESLLTTYLYRPGRALGYVEPEDLNAGFQKKEVLQLSLENLSKLPHTEAIPAAFLLHGESPFLYKNPTRLFEVAIDNGWSQVSSFILKHPDCPSVETLIQLESLTAKGRTHNDKPYAMPLLHALCARPSDFGFELLDQMLDKGFDVNELDKMGRSPLFYASTPGLIRTLLRRGAKTDIKDRMGSSVSTFWALNQDSVTPKNLSRKFECLSEKSSPTDQVESEALITLKGFMDRIKSTGAPSDSLRFNWKELKKYVFEKKAGSISVRLTPLDFLAWHSLSDYSFNSIYYYRKTNGHQACANGLFDGFKTENQSTEVKIPGQDFLSTMMCGVIFGGTELNPQNPWSKNKHHNVASLPEFKQIFEKLKEIPESSWISTYQGAYDCLPLFKKSPEKVRELLNNYLSEVNVLFNAPTFIEDLWEDSSKISSTRFKDEGHHEEFWEKILSEPLLATAVDVARGLYDDPLATNDAAYRSLTKNRKSVLSTNVSPRLIAAQYSAWADRWSRSRNYHELTESEVFKSPWIKEMKRWMDEGVEWPVRPQDKKWFSKNNNLRQMGTFGLNLSSIAHRGNLQKKLRSISLSLETSTLETKSFRKNRL